MSSKRTVSAKPQARSSSQKSSLSAQKSAQQRNLLYVGLAVLAVVIVAVFFMLQQNTPAAGALPAETSVQQASEMFKNGAFLLDVRTQPEWEEAHVDGARLIPLDELAARMSEVPKDQDVVIICRSGNRSAQARDLLRANGFTQVTSVAGGMNDWRAAGLPTVSGP